LTAITATPLIHFPDDAPVLYVNNNGVPTITLNEIKRLGRPASTGSTTSGLSRRRGRQQRRREPAQGDRRESM